MGCGFEVCLTSLLLVTEYDALIHFRFSFLNFLANASLYRNGCAVRVARRGSKVYSFCVRNLAFRQIIFSATLAQSDF
jgi:hypothetical protein